MKTIEDVKKAILGPAILTDLTDVLRSHDKEFVKAEESYRIAVDALRRMLPPGLTPTLDEYLDAHEKDIRSRLVCAGYLGYRINLENFRHPFGIDFLRLDPVDHTRGHIIGCFPVNEEAETVIASFLRALPGDAEPLCDDIEAYFACLECDGPKLAHYAGYIIANHLLPWMEPGYRADDVQTSRFAMDTLSYLGFLPL